MSGYPYRPVDKGYYSDEYSYYKELCSLRKRVKELENSELDPSILPEMSKTVQGVARSGSGTFMDSGAICVGGGLGVNVDDSSVSLRVNSGLHFDHDDYLEADILGTASPLYHDQGIVRLAVGNSGILKAGQSLDISENYIGSWELPVFTERKEFEGLGSPLVYQYYEKLAVPYSLTNSKTGLVIGSDVSWSVVLGHDLPILPRYTRYSPVVSLECSVGCYFDAQGNGRIHQTITPGKFLIMRDSVIPHVQGTVMFAVKDDGSGKILFQISLDSVGAGNTSYIESIFVKVRIAV